MIRLVAVDPAARLGEDLVGRIMFWILEFAPAARCDVRGDSPVEILITGHEGADLHPPLLERVEAIAGCRFRVAAD